MCSMRYSVTFTMWNNLSTSVFPYERYGEIRMNFFWLSWNRNRSPFRTKENIFKYKQSKNKHIHCRKTRVTNSWSVLGLGGWCNSFKTNQRARADKTKSSPRFTLFTFDIQVEIALTGAKLAICVLYCYQSGRAALHICAERGHLEVAKELLEHKAYVNAKSKVRLQRHPVNYSVHTKGLQSN